MDGKRIIQELTAESRRLSEIIKATGKRLRDAPEGSVRIVKHKAGYQYYLRKKPYDKNGSYIPASEYPMAAALVQKKYDERVLAASKKQSRAIERFLKIYDPDCLKSIYGALSDIRQNTIDAVEFSDDEYVRQWKAVVYEHKPFAEDVPAHYTDAGERVRSKSEVMIADALLKAGILYRYEYPLELGQILLHPDFTVLRISDRKTLYWEHLGMMDDPDYINHALHKIRLYESDGIYPGKDLILTMETSRMPINLEIIKRMIRQYLI